MATTLPADYVVTDDRTANLDLPLPSPANLLQDDVPRLRQALGAIDTAWPGKADLVAGKVPASQLPSYVDDVLEFDSLELFPAVGESGKIYTAIDTGRTYRWSGTAYTMLNDFELKPATASTLGGVRVGSGLVVDAQGVVSTVGGAAGEGLPAFNSMTLVASTAGQTVFTISGGYSPGNLDLYNSVGSLLVGNGDDYTATNGTTIVLTEAATLGERFFLRRWTTSTNLPFGALTDTPTTMAGYGIEDHNWGNLGGKPPALAALAESDPLTKSVNGRSGNVTGLVESAIGAARNKSQLMANAPIGQWAAFSDGTGVGADWPPGHPTVNWWNVFTFGTTIAAVRVTQRASQTLNTGYQGWIFERQLHDATWGPWQRILGAASLIENWSIATITAGACTIDPEFATVWWLESATNLSINVRSPRGPGDQVTLRLMQRGSGAFSFTGNNIKLPLGSPGLQLGLNELLTVTLIAEFGGNSVWNLFIGGKHTA